MMKRSEIQIVRMVKQGIKEEEEKKIMTRLM